MTTIANADERPATTAAKRATRNPRMTEPTTIVEADTGTAARSTRRSSAREAAHAAQALVETRRA